jgi:hypothetical protein
MTHDSRPPQALEISHQNSTRAMQSPPTLGEKRGASDPSAKHKYMAHIILWRFHLHTLAKVIKPDLPGRVNIERAPVQSRSLPYALVIENYLSEIYHL